MADDKKIIFSMVGVSKAFQANKQVLKDIYLSFFYGAKIGIIGLSKITGKTSSQSSSTVSPLPKGNFNASTLFNASLRNSGVKPGTNLSEA